jgi:hypothetical protein
MKKISLFSFILFISQFVFGQSDSTNLTTIEAFSNTQSTLIQKIYYSVGTSKQFDVQVLSVKDLVTEKIVKGVIVEWSNPVGTYSVSSYRVFLDSDEIEDLIKALTKLVTIVKANTQESYSEYIFKTRGGFKVSIFSEVGKPWNAAIGNRLTNSFKSFKPEELDKLNQAIIKCRDRVK